jgi:hypothetical protein
LALTLRNGALAQLLSHEVDASEHEEGEIGDILFRVACNTGLEGVVPNRLDGSMSLHALPVPRRSAEGPLNKRRKRHAWRIHARAFRDDATLIAQPV